MHKSDATHLHKCPQLRSLSLKHVLLAESFCLELAKMDHIIRLTLAHCNLTDAHVEGFLQSKTLEYLDIRGNKKLCTPRLIAKFPFDPNSPSLPRMTIKY